MTIQDLKRMFIDIYGGSEDDLRVFNSPGRVNLIGEHTDYCGGFVFPAALTMGTTIIARITDDNTIKLAATDLPDRVVADMDNLDNYRDLKWGNYQIGVAQELQSQGYDIVGCEMLFHDTIPHGGGLSSSAAIEVSTAVALATLGMNHNNKPVDINMIEMAKIGQMTEHHYCGVNCGIMDQFASAMGKENYAIFLNCRTLDYKHVPIQLAGYKIVISNTKVKRSLASSKYNERRKETEIGLSKLQQAMPEKTCLGEISLDEFEAHKHLIEDDIVRMRCEHVIEEDDRVLKSIEALEKGDIIQFGKLINQSGDSLSKKYEVTGFELDTMVAAARKVDGVIGSRMTGAGFGGCTVSIVRDDAVETFVEQVGKEYKDITGIDGEFYVSEIGNGGREII